jgi:hypothetical protein
MFQYNQDFVPFSERDLDQIVDLFDWFRPEDVLFLYTYFGGIVGIAIAIYSTLNFDIFFLFGKNGVLFNMSPELYILFLLLGVPFLYFSIITKIRKRYSKGYLGRKIKKATQSKLQGNKYSPFDKYLYDDL